MQRSLEKEFFNRSTRELLQNSIVRLAGTINTLILTKSFIELLTNVKNPKQNKCRSDNLLIISLIKLFNPI